MHRTIRASHKLTKVMNKKSHKLTKVIKYERSKIAKPQAHQGDEQKEPKTINRKQGNYSLRRPPKLIIPQAVIRH